MRIFILKVQCLLRVHLLRGCFSGTTGTVSDPHEIANILGIQGVDFMIEDGRKTPFKLYFGAPSCVPATILKREDQY
jgi:adenine deaminase